MSVRATIAVTILLVWGATPVLACRARIVDPFVALDPAQSDSSPSPDSRLVAIYLGEIVGIRNAGRLGELRRCQPRLGPSDEPPALDCIENFSETYELEIWPTREILGRPTYPAHARISGCLMRPPPFGAEVLILESDNGWSLARMPEAHAGGYPFTFDDAWLKRLEQCVRERHTCWTADAPE